ncbi:MAG: universal stress protein [Paludibacter sp.]|nr:universal stress protein [Bacteroidales bacterium]MCM1069957.1 universal stress protein [Prevotella sp.]MCM1354557.1 universal stress protein [Bacteroides sp.]MCM1443568.1 universal stress protein [Muribaculum sp.]MCM1482640.1 universal stress protein [Paludibacter sp.]
MNIVLLTSESTSDAHHYFVDTLVARLEKKLVCLNEEPEDWETYTEQHDVDMLCISCRNDVRLLQHHLNACRSLRIPYLFLTDTMKKIQSLHVLLLPVTMLEEEVHKAQIGSSLARYTGAEIVLLRAHDYGSKAKRNTERMCVLFDKLEVSYRVEEARKDSAHVMRELTDRQRDFLSDLIILTASREYGLDDILFGPPERGVIRRSMVPVMLLNPRGDLYSLCD